MAQGPDIDPVTGTQTTGHVWDGIRELNTPLPRWWLWAVLHYDCLVDRILGRLSRVAAGVVLFQRFLRLAVTRGSD